MFVRLARFALSVTAYSLLLCLIVALGLFAIGIATVDEARSVGKQVLLSSIPAHCEQNPPEATFFDPHNCADLAEKLGHTWGKTVPGPDVNLELEARQNLPSRLRAYATGFVSIAREAIGEVGR